MTRPSDDPFVNVPAEDQAASGEEAPVTAASATSATGVDVLDAQVSSRPLWRRWPIWAAFGGVLLAASAAAVVLFTSGGKEPSSSRAAAYGQMLEACSTTDCVIDALKVTFKELGAQETLEVYMATGPDSFGGIDCHEATHELGRWAWRSENMGAWFASPESCNFGYYHGVTFAAAENETFEGFREIGLDLCGARALSAEVLPAHECAHGYGHAVMTLVETVESASFACEEFPAENMRRRCNEGVAKEALNRPLSSVEEFMDCRAWPQARVGVCEYVGAAYRTAYTPSDQFVDLVPLCRTRAVPQECLAGLGRGVVMKVVMSGFSNPGAWADIVCGGEEACAEGFGGLVYTLRNDVDWSLEQCSLLGEIEPACVRGVRASEQNF